MNDPFAQLLLVFTPFVALFGACIGSFLSVCIYRIPRDESIVAPRSHCPNCGKLIAWYDNIPVLSWLLLGGKCRHCGNRISFRYPLLELVAALLFLVAWTQGLAACSPSFRPPLGIVTLPALAVAPVYWLVIWGLILATVVDFEHYIIPDCVTIGGMVTGFAISAALPALHGQTSHLLAMRDSAIGLAVGFSSIWLIGALGKAAFKKDAMGFGDVKFMGAIGAFFGWEAVVFTILAASLLGSVFGIAMIAARRRDLGGRIPFGPFIAMACLIWMLWGGALLDWYLGLLRFTPQPMM